jgi:hypothetical protein
MTCPHQERIPDLAVAIVRQEELTREMEQLLSHVEQCPECASELRAYQQMAPHLLRTAENNTDGSASADCPDDNTLACLLDGRLPKDKVHAIELHLAHCGHCCKQLADLTAILDEPPLRASVAEFALALKDGALEWVRRPGTGFIPLSASPLPVLASPAREPDARRCAWTQEYGGIRLAFCLTYEHRGRMDLTLHVLSDAVVPEGTNATLWSKGVMVQSERVDQDGQIAFQGLDCPEYEGEVNLPGESPLRFFVQVHPADLNET